MIPSVYNNQFYAPIHSREPHQFHHTQIPPAPPINSSRMFSELREKTNHAETPPSYDKNYRFDDIVCPYETRVQLPMIDGFYLHANHVALEGLNFIATQYPLPEQVPLFWHAATNAPLIVDLTNENDMKKQLDSYYPGFGNQKNFNELIVKCVSKETFRDVDFPIYHYSITKKGAESEEQAFPPHQIPRLHFKEWPDHGGITEDQLDQLLAVIGHYQKNSPNSIVVHCRAGVGRTGTLIVASALQNLINQEKVDKSNLLNHLSRLILEGREQRGPSFVQTEEQFLALWKWSWRAIHRQPIQSELLLDNLEHAQMTDQPKQYNDDGTPNPNWIIENPHISLIELGISDYEKLKEFLKKHGPSFKHKSLNLKDFNLELPQLMEVLQLCEAL